MLYVFTVIYTYLHYNLSINHTKIYSKILDILGKQEIKYYRNETNSNYIHVS